MAEVDAKNRVDIREEEPETTALRILGMLRILKYKPPMEISANFRQGLVEGQKQVLNNFDFRITPAMNDFCWGFLLVLCLLLFL